MDAMNSMNAVNEPAADDGLASLFGRFYKIGELARLMKVSPGTLYAAIENGELEAHHFGGTRGTLRVEHTAFAQYLSLCKAKGLARAA